MRFPFLTVLTCSIALAGSASAFAQTPDDFVHTGHAQLNTLLQQPPSAQRDAQISSAFDQMMDYDELVRRCFKEHWADLDAAKQAEVSGLLKQLVRRNYRKNLDKTKDYNVTYTGVRNQGGNVVVRTQAQSKIDPRSPVVQIDYEVEGTPPSGPFHVVDIIAENSSTTKNYYRDFHRFLTDPSKGYPYLVQKLKDKLNAP